MNFVRLDLKFLCGGFGEFFIIFVACESFLSCLALIYIINAFDLSDYYSERILSPGQSGEEK
jgi:hypothetical protein